MPYRRRTLRRKRFRPRRYRKRTYINRPLKSYRGRTFQVVRSCTQPGYQTTTGSAAVYTLYFMLTQLPNYSEFTGLFDEYMIRKVVVTFINTAAHTITGADQIAGRNPPVLYSVIDYDDAATPANGDVLLQYPGCKLTSAMFKRKSWVFKPKAQQLLFGASGTPTGSRRRTWINCANGDVPHYGIKFLLTAAPNGLVYYSVFTRFYLAFRGVR